MIKSLDMGGLDEALRHARPGVGMTCAQIAAYGKCSESNIRKVERNAIRHIRELHPDLRDLIQRELYA